MVGSGRLPAKAVTALYSARWRAPPSPMRVSALRVTIDWRRALGAP
jgi:hypothetical protein